MTRMSGDALDELLGAYLKIQPGILVGLPAGHSRDPLHEIEDALCRVRDYAE
jgi:hypothetical protein